MDPVPPIQGIDETQSFKTNGINHLSHQQPLHAIVDGREIDHSRLAKDQDYFLETMKYIYDKARANYNNFQYSYAHELFEQFFRYLKTYRPHHYSKLVDFYPAILDFSWVMEIQGQRKEAQKFINQELMRILEPVVVSKQPKHREIQDTIKSLQAHNSFPTHTNPDIEIPVDELAKLAKLFTNIGEKPVAVHILKHMEIRYLLGAYRTQNMIRELDSKEKESLNQTTTSPMQGYSHFGVPVSPVIPADMGSNIAEIKKKIYFRYGVDKVDPVYGINKDPRDNERRGRRQRNSKTAYKRVKSLKVRRKPTITI